MRDKLLASSRNQRARRNLSAANVARVIAFAFIAISLGAALPSLARAVAAPRETTARSLSSDPTQIEANLDRFLDRLMHAESAGIDAAKNPRSTALGPFQFIESTFLDLVDREFADETRTLERADILRLRTNRDFSRQVARVYVRDSAGALIENGEAAGYGNLRLAYLLGSKGALLVLKAKDTAAVGGILGRAVVKANPFLARMSAGRLTRWSAENIGEDTLPGGNTEAVEKNAVSTATPSKLSARRAKQSETSKPKRLAQRASGKKLAAVKPRAGRVKGRAMVERSV